MCFSPKRRAIFRHLNFKKCSRTLSFLTFSLPNVLFATAACNFSTSELQKVLRACSRYCIFFLLTWLLYSAFQLSILSEVCYLNFLRPQILHGFPVISYHKSCMTFQSYPTTNLAWLSSHSLPQISHDFPVISYHKSCMTFQSYQTRNLAWLSQSYPTANLPWLSSHILPKSPMTFQSGVPCSHFRGHCWAMLVVGILPWNQTEHLWTGSEQSESWNTLLFGQTTYSSEEAVKRQILLLN